MHTREFFVYNGEGETRIINAIKLKGGFDGTSIVYYLSVNERPFHCVGGEYTSVVAGYVGKDGILSFLVSDDNDYNKCFVALLDLPIVIMNKVYEEIVGKDAGECPYCGSTNCTESHCSDCGADFDDEDYEIEDIRHQVSAILMDTDEDNQRQCEIMELGSDEACGLSSLEMPECDRCFQFEDGTMWFHLKGTPDEDYANFDDFCVEDLRKILVELRGLT